MKMLVLMLYLLCMCPVSEMWTVGHYSPPLGSVSCLFLLACIFCSLSLLSLSQLSKMLTLYFALVWILLSILLSSLSGPSVTALFKNFTQKACLTKGERFPVWMSCGCSLFSVFFFFLAAVYGLAVRVLSGEKPHLKQGRSAEERSHALQCSQSLFYCIPNDMRTRRDPVRCDRNVL